MKDRIAAGDDEDDDEDDDEQAVAESQRSLLVTPSQSRHGRRTSSPARTASCWLTRPRWSMVSVHTAVGWSESTMNDDDDVTEKLLDALVYAPLGLALEAKDLLPKLAERGRGQVALTRLAGTVAAREGSPRRSSSSTNSALGSRPSSRRTPMKRPPTPPRASPVPTPSCRSRGTPHSPPSR